MINFVYFSCFFGLNTEFFGPVLSQKLMFPLISSYGL